MPTYEERARVLWQSLSLADKKRIHGFLTIDRSASWSFDPINIADLCESHPEIPLALQAMVANDERTASPNENSDVCLARASQLFERAETVARTISDRFGGGMVPEESYKQIQSGLALNEEPRQGNLKKLWEGARLWSAPRDCARLQLLVGTVEEELPDHMKPTIKEEDYLAEKAEARLAHFIGDLEKRGRSAKQILRQLEDATAAKEITYLESKLSIENRKMRYIWEKLQVQEARAKYLRWGDRPIGHFDPYDELQLGILDYEAEQDESTIPDD